MSDMATAHVMAEIIANHLAREEERSDLLEVREELEKARLFDQIPKWSPGFARVDLVASEGSVVIALGDTVETRDVMIVVHRPARDDRNPRTFYMPCGAVKLITLIQGNLGVRGVEGMQWKTPELPEAIA